MNVVEWTGVTRRFGPLEALHGVTLAIPPGQVVGLIGRNGAGKSTLLRLVPPLIHATGGTVRVFGVDPWDHQEAIKQRLGYVGDSDPYPLGICARDVFELCAAVYRRWDQALIERFLARLSIDVTRPLVTLSKGTQRQVGLLCAIGHRPELLLLDEPAGNLDVAVRREFLAVLVDLLAESGTAVILATHLLTDIERLAQRLVILDQGRVVDDGGVDDIKASCCRVDIAGPPEVLKAIDGWSLCLHRQDQPGAVTAVLACPCERSTELIMARLGSGAAVRAVQDLGLEDVFIHRTGDHR